MVKIVDVARAAGVSAATVSRALNHHTTVHPDLARRVADAAAALGYRPNVLARNLRRQRTFIWMLVISDIENAFFTSIARGVGDVARQHGFSVVLCNADEDADREAAYVDLATQEHAAGVIVSPHSGRTRLGLLREHGIPFVVVDREADVSSDSVLVDSRSGAREATAHLLAAGWRRPACITGPRDADTARRRRQGFEDAVRAAGLPRAPVSHRPFRSDGGQHATARLLDREEPPDALFVGNANLTLGVLEELRLRGLRPGRDVGLVTFDDAPWAPFIDPPISVVRQPAYRVGVEAARLLLARLDGSAPEDPVPVVLEPELLVRDSSRRTP